LCRQLQKKMFPAPGRTMLRNPQRTFLVDRLAPIVHTEVNKLRALYGTAVREGRRLTPEEYDRATEITNDLHRQYHYHYFMNFVPPPDLKALIDRYYHGDGPRQWGLHMGRRAVTEARVAWARLHGTAETETAAPMESESSSSAYPLEPLADVPVYQELQHRLREEAPSTPGGIHSDEHGSEVTAVPLDDANDDDSGPVKRAGDYSSNEEQGYAPVGPRSFFPHPIPASPPRARPAVVDLTKSSDDNSE
jgi:hypothetical protein